MVSNVIDRHFTPVENFVDNMSHEFAGQDFPNHTVTSDSQTTPLRTSLPEGGHNIDFLRWRRQTSVHSLARRSSRTESDLANRQQNEADEMQQGESCADEVQDEATLRN